MKDDLDKYISRRKKRDARFAKNFESGYQELKVGVLLRQARTQVDWETTVTVSVRDNGLGGERVGRFSAFSANGD